MKREDVDDVAQACVEYFCAQMTLKGWLGKALGDMEKRSSPSSSPRAEPFGRQRRKKKSPR
jgi:hypothetical protein